MSAERLICPECKRDDFTDPRHLGRHRRFVHSVAGAKNFKRDGTPRKGATVPPGITATSIAPPPRSTARLHPFTCDVCKERFKDAVILGRHRRARHGIPGKSAKYGKKHRDKQKAIALVEPAAVELNGNGHHRGRAATQSPNGFPLQFIGHVVGYLERCCHEEAFKNDLPAKTFTRDVAEFFLAKMTIGQ